MTSNLPFSNFSQILQGLNLLQTAETFTSELNNSIFSSKLSKYFSSSQQFNLSSFSPPSNIKKDLSLQSRFSNLPCFKKHFTSANSIKILPSFLTTHNDSQNLNLSESQVQSKSLLPFQNLNNEDKINSSNIEEDSIFNNLNSSQNSYKPNHKTSTRGKIFSGSMQLDKFLKIQNIKIEPNEQSNLMDSSSFFQNSQSQIIHEDHNNNNLNKSDIDEYVDDDDPGFDLYECDREYHDDTSKKLSEQYGFPDRAVYKSKYTDLIRPDRHDSSSGEKKINLPENAKFMSNNDSYYPIINNNVFLDAFDLKIVINREKIGFDPEKEIKFTPNMLIAGRFKFIKELGDAAFSTAIQCYDILENKMICIKVIKNNKDYFDQSIDEIKLLRYINANGDPEQKCFLKIYDYFYYKEHLMIISELLKDNLYDFYKYINDNNIEYFTIPRIQKLTKQILLCLEFIHSLKIIHCDLKPENILMKSISDTTCKVIDFGSSCFIHDHLSTYIQSRSYRAPEVILGCKYDYKIDMWSLGCILVEIYTGNVLFQNDSIQSMLARIIGICGPIPDWMFEKGKLVNDFFTKEKLLYMEPNENNSSLNQSTHNNNGKSKKIHILVPKKSSLKKRIRTSDDNFFHFIKRLLEIDPNVRISAKEALNHPWIKDVKYNTK